MPCVPLGEALGEGEAVRFPRDRDRPLAPLPAPLAAVGLFLGVPLDFEREAGGGMVLVGEGPPGRLGSGNFFLALLPRP